MSEPVSETGVSDTPEKENPNLNIGEFRSSLYFVFIRTSLGSHLDQSGAKLGPFGGHMGSLPGG